MEYFAVEIYFLTRAESASRVLYAGANVKNIKSSNKAQDPCGPNFLALFKNYFSTQADRTSHRIISFFVTDPMSEYSQKELLLDGILICYLSSNSHMDL